MRTQNSDTYLFLAEVNGNSFPIGKKQPKKTYNRFSKEGDRAVIPIKNTLSIKIPKRKYSHKYDTTIPEELYNMGLEDIALDQGLAIIKIYDKLFSGKELIYKRINGFDLETDLQQIYSELKEPLDKINCDEMIDHLGLHNPLIELILDASEKYELAITGNEVSPELRSEVQILKSYLN